MPALARFQELKRFGLAQKFVISFSVRLGHDGRVMVITPKVEGYFKITTSVIDACCSALERDALACLAMQGICLNPSSQRLGDNDDLLKMIFNYSMESALWREYLMAQTPPVALH